MNKMSLIIIVFLVTFADINSACDRSKEENCLAVRKFAISEAGPDIPRICQAERNYIFCLSSIGCHDNATFGQMVDDINEMCRDGGSMTTVSMLTVALALITVLIQ